MPSPVRRLAVVAVPAAAAAGAAALVFADAHGYAAKRLVKEVNWNFYTYPTKP